jgi:hypothetical protein
MLKYGIVAALLLGSATTGAQSIVVDGKGIDFQTAKNNAFQKAIENVCGVNILSNKEFRNNITIHNSIVSYSSCRIKKYEVLEEDLDRVLLRVDVEKLSSADRFTAHPNQENNFDQEQVRTAVQSYYDEKISGDQLISELFRDYPYNAFELRRSKSPYITSDAYRNLYLIVPFDLRWNTNYVNSIREILSLLQVSHGVGTVKILAKNPKSFFGYTTHHNLNDVKRINDMKKYMSGPNEFRLKIVANDGHGNKVIDTCYVPEYRSGSIFYSIGVHNQITIFGDDKSVSSVSIRLAIPPDSINDLTVAIVAAKDCKL